MDGEALHFVKEALGVNTHYPTHKIIDTLGHKCNAAHREVGYPTRAEQHRLNTSARPKLVKLQDTSRSIWVIVHMTKITYLILDHLQSLGDIIVLRFCRDTKSNVLRLFEFRKLREEFMFVCIRKFCIVTVVVPYEER